MNHFCLGSAGGENHTVKSLLSKTRRLKKDEKEIERINFIARCTKEMSRDGIKKRG